MSRGEERQRRASIKAILADDSITPQERRRSIQSLMDGRRSSIGTASVASSLGSLDRHGAVDADPYFDDPQFGLGNGVGGNRGSHDGEQPNPEDYICIPISNENTKRAEQTRPHCVHYDRKCSLVAYCCGAVFGCRICHDDSPILPPLLIQKQMMGAAKYPRSSSMPMGGLSLIHI